MIYFIPIMAGTMEVVYMCYIFYFLLSMCVRTCVGEVGDDLRFYLRFNSISCTSGRLVGDNEGCVQCPPPFTTEKLSASPAGLEPGTARSVDQRLTY